MASFQNGAVEIAYLDEGAGEPIVLVHGFASTARVNWVFPGWVVTLTEAGRRVIALDNRGHGASSKLYDPAAYHTTAMMDDVARAARPSWRRARRHHGLLHGRAHRGVHGRLSFGTGALAHSRRPRHPPGAGRRPAGVHRRRLGSAVTRGRERPERPHLPLLRRTDPIGFARTRRLHPRLATDAHARTSAPVSACPRWSRSEPRTMWRVLRRSSPRSFRARGRSTSLAAITCSALATKCSKRACSIFLSSAPER